MEIINCIQGSEEWLDMRRGIATASNFSKVVTTAGATSKQINDYGFQLASELITNIQEESYKNADMQRGNDLESEARDEYQQEKLTSVEEVGFIKCGFYGYSPDGFIGKDGLLEIKCPKQNTHTKYIFDQKLPGAYKAQVQGGMLATGRKWCDFVSYHPNFDSDKRLFIIRVKRDDEFIEQLLTGLNKLNEHKNKILDGIRLS